MTDSTPTALFAAIDSGDAATLESILATMPGLASARDEDGMRTDACPVPRTVGPCGGACPGDAGS